MHYGKRRNYLTSIMKNQEENHPVIYLDETWANAHDGKDKPWVEKDEITGGTIGGIKRPSEKGLRLIILHADSENRWVPNCALIFKSGRSTGMLIYDNIVLLYSITHFRGLS